MTHPNETTEHRKLRRVARQYERDGYRVTMPATDGITGGAKIPDFLEGFSPDLIAESDHDRVVVEVKQSRSLRGSNELSKIAERIASAPGWRFELVTVPSQEAETSLQDLRFAADRARKAAGDGYIDQAFPYFWLVTEQVLAGLATENQRKATGLSAMQVARDLVSQGIISHEAFGSLARARAIRDRLAHAEPCFRPSEEDLTTLLRLADELFSLRQRGAIHQVQPA